MPWANCAADRKNYRNSLVDAQRFSRRGVRSSGNLDFPEGSTEHSGNHDSTTMIRVHTSGDSPENDRFSGFHHPMMIHQKMRAFQDFTTQSILAVTSRRSGTVQNRPVPALKDSRTKAQKNPNPNSMDFGMRTEKHGTTTIRRYDDTTIRRYDDTILFW